MLGGNVFYYLNRLKPYLGRHITQAKTNTCDPGSSHKKKNAYILTEGLNKRELIFSDPNLTDTRNAF